MPSRGLVWWIVTPHAPRCLLYRTMATHGIASVKSPSLYAIQEEVPVHSEIKVQPRAVGKPKQDGPHEILTTCERINLAILKIVLHTLTVLLTILTFTFAIIVAPLAIYLGRPASSAKLKQNIRKLGGKFVEWGKQNEYVVEYFVYGSTGDDSDVLLLFSGAFSPGDLWQKLHGENNVDVWGKRLGLKVICITNGGLGCSSLPSSLVISMDDIEEYTTKVLKQEGVGDKFFVGGLSQGSQACTVVADRFGERVQGCLMMCPYMPFMKAYEVFHGGPIVSNYLTIHPMKTPVSALKSVFPPNFALWMLLHNILPIVKHSFCLFQGWLGFGQMRFAISPDMLAATCRLNCEGKTDINDAIFSGLQRSAQFNMYGEATLWGFGEPQKVSQYGKIPVVIVTDINSSQIPDILCPSKHSWWWAEQIPGARLLCCDEGYGHYSEFVYVERIMMKAIPYLRQHSKDHSFARSTGYRGEASSKEHESVVLQSTQQQNLDPCDDDPLSVISGRTSVRSRYKRRDIYNFIDHKVVDPPDCWGRTPIPWFIKRQTSIYQSAIDQWFEMAYICKFHFGLAFVFIAVGLSYSYTTYEIAYVCNAPTVVCVALAIILGPTLILYLITLAYQMQPNSGVKIIMNGSRVILNGGVTKDEVNPSITAASSLWNFASVSFFLIWIGVHALAIIYSVSENDTLSWSQMVPPTPTAPLLIWHGVMSTVFAYTVAYLLSLLSMGVKCAKACSHEIISRIRMWAPSQVRSVDDSASLSSIATLISIFEEQVVENLSGVFGVIIHTALLSTFILIASIVTAVLEDRSLMKVLTKGSLVSFGFVFGLAVFAVHSLMAMGTTTAVCANIRRSANRMKLRLVEYLDEDNGDEDTNVIGYGAFVQVIFKRVDAFCQGLSSNHLGFRLSGFIVTPRLTMQVLYSFCTVLFLVLAGGRSSTAGV